MTEFIEGEEAATANPGEYPNGNAAADNPNPVLARAKEILARQPTVADLEEQAARRRRNAKIEAMPDLETLQRRWITNEFMTDEQFNHMRRLEALERLKPSAPPKPVAPVTRQTPTVRRATENLLDRARLHELEIKVKGGGRWTDAERAEWWALHGTDICAKADRLLGKNRVGSAIALLVKELAIVAISQSRNRERLEDRIAALEPKPRVRVKAIQQVIT